MSNGDRESRGLNHKEQKISNTSGGDEFVRAIATIAIAQILESTGFHSSHRSSTDALVEVLIRYIADLGRAAAFHANVSGRTSCNVFDVLQGLEEFGLSQGSSGASDYHCCAVSSGVVREIATFVKTEEERPFAASLPRFPIAPIPKLMPSFAEAGRAAGGKHIPEWLPSFPDTHTYIYTPVWNERSTDLRADKLEQVRQRRKAERSLLNLQQRLACNSTFGVLPTVDIDSKKGKQVVESNPLLAPPLLNGEREVPEIVIPSETASSKRFSVLETFAPAFEAAKSGMLDAGGDERRALPNNRPVVTFKFGIAKKSMAASLSLDISDGKKGSWLRDDEKDDKKRRAEMILKQAMENPQELAQL